MKSRQHVLGFLALALVLVTLSGCVPKGPEAPAPASYGALSGFLWGVWHGWIAPVTLVWGLFDHSVRIFQADNPGWWYGLGFYMGILGGFGGLSLTRKKRDKKPSEKESTG